MTKITLNALQHNARAFAQLTGKPVCAVVKADAYGHGAVETVNALQGIVNAFAVSILDEAIAIRTVACGKEILIFTPPFCKADAENAIVNGFSVTVDGLRTAKLVSRCAERLKRKVKVHLKVNTGMNRYGAELRGFNKVCQYLKNNKYVQIVGLYSHLYATKRDIAEAQLLAFTKFQRICERYFPIVICHIGATYGAVLDNAFALDMVRIGLGLYGYIPDGAEDLDEKRIIALALQPCMRVYAQVVAKRKYFGGGLGYGSPKERLQKGDTINVLRIGYADGVFRLANALTKNTLCMDACVRKGDLPVGKQVKIMEDAQAFAKQAGTISYEILCAMSSRAERMYTYGKFTVGRKRKRRRKNV